MRRMHSAISAENAAEGLTQDLHDFSDDFCSSIIDREHKPQHLEPVHTAAVDTMEITPILSAKACAFPPGLFHHAKVHNNVVYTTGQIGGDVKGKLVSDEISGQAEQMFANLAAILEAAGSSLSRVLTANIYLTDKANYKVFNEVYTRLMPDPKPPRTCVFVASLPADALCEMTLTAAIGT